MRILIYSLLLFIPGFLLGQAGTLDPTFGTDGIRTFCIGEECLVSDMGIGNNGKLYIGGSTRLQGDTLHKGFIARMYPDGALDTSFATNGIKYLYLNDTSNLYVRELKILNDGGLSCIGDADPDDRLFYARLDKKGELVDTVGNSGVALPFQDSLENHYFYSHHLLPDGGAYILTTQFFNDYIYKVNKYGELDSSFMISMNEDFPDKFEAIKAVHTTAEGELFVSGYKTQSGLQDFALYVLALQENGGIDSVWGKNGYLEYDVHYPVASAVSRLLFSHDNLSGYIVYSNYRQEPDSTVNHVFRFNQKTGSKYYSNPIKNPFTNYIKYRDVNEQADGRFIVGGEYIEQVGGHRKIVLIRYSNDLVIDSTFSNDGYFEFPNVPEMGTGYDLFDVEFNNSNKGIYLLVRSYNPQTGLILKLNSESKTDITSGELQNLNWDIVNPQSDRKWEFTLPETIRGDYSLNVFDRRGAIIAEKEFNSPIDRSGQIEVPAGLSAGFYFVLLQTDDGFAVRKIMYQNSQYH